MSHPERIRPLDIPFSPDIHRPGEVVELTDNHNGRILCDTLIVHSGVRAPLRVTARRVYVHGTVNGSIEAELVTIARVGSFVGHCRAGRLNVAGRINGLAYARSIWARDAAVLEGEVLADRLERTPTTQIQAMTVVGPGFSENANLLKQALERLSPRPPRPAVREEPVVEMGDAIQPPRREPVRRKVDPDVEGVVIPFLLR